MKKTLLVIGLSVAALGVVRAQTVLTQNFDALAAPALPTGWISTPAGVWKSGAPNSIAPNAQAGMGYNLNNAAYMNAMGVDGSQATANNSTIYTNSFSLPASLTDAYFLFDMAYFGVRLTADATKKETVLFVVSTDGGTTWSNGDTVAANQTYLWETRGINLASYIGNTNVKVGFKYVNNGGALIGVVFDNFKIFSGKDARMVVASGGSNPANGKGYQQSGTTTQIKGTVQNLGSGTISSYVVKYKQGSNAAQSYNVTGANIAPLATGTFTHSVPFNVAANAEYPIKVWVELADDNNTGNDSTDVTVVGVPFIPAKKVLFEEGTGTWCVWCPRGAVFMEKFAEDFPGKAAQVAVHNGDGMAVSTYDSYMSSLNGGGFPNLVTDRTLAYTSDPSDINDLYNVLKDNFGFAEVTMGTPTVSGTTVSVPVTVKPAVNITSPRLALIVTESNVHSSRPGTGAQKNAYAGGSYGVMGGWEAQPQNATNVNYHFVSRAVSPSPAGDAMGLPATLTANTTYNATLTATLNAEWQTNNLQYIVTLGDASSKVIFNTAFSPLPHLQPGLPTSVVNVEAGIDEATLYPNPVNGNEANLKINANIATELNYTVTDLAGRVVLKGETSNIFPGVNTISISTNNLNNGLYLVNIQTSKGNSTIKFQVVK